MNRGLIGLSVLLLLVVHSPASSQPQWTRQLGTPEWDNSRDVAADGLGNVYIAGETAGDLAGPNAGTAFDAFLAKYDGAGNLQWARQLGTSQSEGAEGVAADGLGNVYITGGQNGLFVAKYDGDGNLQWQRNEPGYGLSISADGLGSVYVAGYRSGSGGIDAFLSKYDDGGSFQWTRTLGTTALDVGRSVASDSLGNIYLGGDTTGDLGGSNAGGYDAFIAKYDSTGALQWTRQIGTDAGDTGGYLTTDGLGNAYLAGTTFGSLVSPIEGSTDVFISKFDTTGNLEWARQFGPSSSDSAYDISADQFGNSYVTSNSINFGPTLTKYDSQGNFQWNRFLQGGQYSQVSADSLHNLFVSGYIDTDLSSGDAILAKFTEIVPEPGSVALLCLALTAIGRQVRRRSRLP